MTWRITWHPTFQMKGDLKNVWQVLVTNAQPSVWPTKCPVLVLSQTHSHFTNEIQCKTPKFCWTWNNIVSPRGFAFAVTRISHVVKYCQMNRPWRAKWNSEKTRNAAAWTLDGLMGCECAKDLKSIVTLFHWGFEVLATMQQNFRLRVLDWREATKQPWKIGHHFPKVCSTSCVKFGENWCT